MINHRDRKVDVRLNKYISDTGYCSRREADRLVEAGRVTVNGETASLGGRVLPSDDVRVDGEILHKKESRVYIALNKPAGITCTTDRSIKGNISDFVNYGERIFPIGRLDKDSQGLILLTNDGDIVNKILRAGNNHEKEYVVTVNKPFDEKFLKAMSEGVPVLGSITKKCYIRREGRCVFTIILTQGLNRQIRRMCSYFGYNVVKLNRIRIMNITLGSLEMGKWRYLTSDELSKIESLISDSGKTEEFDD